MLTITYEQGSSEMMALDGPVYLDTGVLANFFMGYIDKIEMDGVVLWDVKWVI